MSPLQAKGLIRQELEKDIPLFDVVNMLITFEGQFPELWNDFAHLLNEESMDERTRLYLKSHRDGDERAWNDRYDIAKALLTVDPPIETYWDGRYYLKPRIFMFCRDNVSQ